MTYFLDPNAPDIQPSGPDKQLSGWWTGLGAFTSKLMQEKDANLLHRTQVQAETHSVARPAADRIGVDALKKRYLEEGNSWGYKRLPPKTVDEFFNTIGTGVGNKIALDLAREDAASNPEKWKDLDLTDKGIDDRVTAKRIADERDYEETIAMMPSGRGSAAFIGGLAATVADMRQLPLLALGGGGGSFLKVMAREAALNVGAEAVTLPSQFAVAKELGLEKPDVKSHLAMAAIGGAVLGAGGEALGRGLKYASGRNAVAQVPGFTRTFSEALTNAAEDALTRGENPFEAAAQAAIDMPHELATGRPPLVPETKPIPQETPAQATQEAPATQEPVSQGAADQPPDNYDPHKQFHEDFPEMRAKYPLAEMIRNLGGLKSKEKNPVTGEWQKTTVAQDLEAMGITPRTHPFMFNNKTGRAELDNLVASEHYGLADVLPVDHQTGYFDRQGLVDALGKELGGGGKTPLSAEIEARLRELDMFDNPDKYRPAVQDFVEGKKSDLPDTLYFTPDEANFLEYDLVASSFDAWAARTGMDEVLTPHERSEVIWELSQRGGDAQNLIETLFERENNFAKAQRRREHEGASVGGHEPTSQADLGGSHGSGEGPSPDGRGAGGGSEGSAHDGGPLFEATGAGQQSLIPGVRPVTTKERLEALQSKPLSGSQGHESEIGGLFDPGDMARSDLFDEPSSAKARPVLDQKAADMVDQITKDGDFMVDLGDGKGERPASSILADLDLDEKEAARLSLCGAMRE